MLSRACLNLPGEFRSGKLHSRDDTELRRVNRNLSSVCGGKGTPGRGTACAEAQKHLACSRKNTWLGTAREWDVCLRGGASGDKLRLEKLVPGFLLPVCPCMIPMGLLSLCELQHAQR